MLTTELIEQILLAAPRATIGLLGDLFLDRYLDIDPALDEPSIETGLTAYQVTRVRSYPGALGTVLNNLAALGVGRLVPVTVIGDDGEGYELRQALQALSAVDPATIVCAPDRRTPTYTKPMVMEPLGSARELNRLDIKNRLPTPLSLQDQVIELLDANWSRCEAFIVLDQVSEAECGVVTSHVRDHLIQQTRLDPNKFVLADSRAQVDIFDCMALKPNSSEFARLRLPRSQAIFQTDGAQGIWLHEPNHAEPIHIPPYPVTGPIDIVGAGDSCSAGIACGMVAGVGARAAAAFGNLVASITIQQIGVTGTATPEQVRERWHKVAG